MQALVEFCSHLETLHGMVADEQLHEESLIYFVQCCLQLRSIGTLSGPSVTDRVVLALAAHSKYLREIRFGECPSLTNMALVDLMVACPSLHRLFFTSARDHETLNLVLHTMGIKVHSFVDDDGVIHMIRT